MPTKRKRKPHNLVAREATVKMQLRLPRSIHRELRRTAKKNRCSMHAEILHRLRWEAQQFNKRTISMLLGEILHGEQAATWTTPKSWAKAQERPPTQERS